MNEFTITIQAPELAKAILRLAAALENSAIVNTEIKPQITTAEDEQVPTPDEQADTSKEEIRYKIEDVRAAFADYAKLKGKDKAKEILSEFGAEKVTELKKSDYNAVMEMLKEG